MKKEFSLFLLCLFVTGCSASNMAAPTSPVINEKPAVENISTSSVNTQNIPEAPANPFTGWDKAKLDTARNTNWPAFDKDVVFLLNMVRSEPTRFAREFLEPMKAKFDGNILSAYGSNIITKEGISAVEEAINTLKTAAPAAILNPAEGLHLSALDHVKDIGPAGIFSHQGTDGSTPAERMSRYGVWKFVSAENIDFGAKSPLEAITILLIDDGVPDRGHRKTILNNEHRKIGVASGMHKTFGTMTVTNFAGIYNNK